MSITDYILVSLIFFSLLWLNFSLWKTNDTLKTIQEDLAFLRKGSRATQWKKD